MSISDIRKQLRNESILYGAFTLFVLAFGIIYEKFSHGVSSNYMIFAFLFPLFAGCMNGIYRIIQHELAKNSIGQDKMGFSGLSLAPQLLGGAIIWLTLGCVFEGVLQIYGTTNQLIGIFNIIGLIQLVAAVVIGIISLSRK